MFFFTASSINSPHEEHTRSISTFTWSDGYEFETPATDCNQANEVRREAAREAHSSTDAIDPTADLHKSINARARASTLVSFTVRHNINVQQSSAVLVSEDMYGPTRRNVTRPHMPIYCKLQRFPPRGGDLFLP